jgi:hypothetical protein
MTLLQCGDTQGSELRSANAAPGVQNKVGEQSGCQAINSGEEL